MMFCISKCCFTLFDKAANVCYYELGLYIKRDCSSTFLMFHTDQLCIHNALVCMCLTLLCFPYINKGILVSLSEGILETEVVFFNKTKQTYLKNTSSSPKMNNYLDICLEVSGKISVIQLAFGQLHVSWNISHGRRKSFYRQRCHVACCILLINAYWLIDKKLLLSSLVFLVFFFFFFLLIN